MSSPQVGAPLFGRSRQSLPWWLDDSVNDSVLKGGICTEVLVPVEIKLDLHTTATVSALPGSVYTRQAVELYGVCSEEEQTPTDNIPEL